ncbi:hypothetical protein ACFCZ1_12440 [Streptomyces sp. NPDC056224]|uniref:hypothetical protein n=1 Tax=Streptomyces sp. NPDC056224 TaxID=3345750 RepID=UPI0035DE7732
MPLGADGSLGNAEYVIVADPPHIVLTRIQLYYPARRPEPDETPVSPGLFPFLAAPRGASGPPPEDPDPAVQDRCELRTVAALSGGDQQGQRPLTFV